MKPSKPRHKSPKTYSGRAFEGILLEPMEVPRIPDLTGISDELDKEIMAICENVGKDRNRQFAIRLLALMDHYGIEHDFDSGSDSMYYLLVKALVVDFLPGFQQNLPPSKGRPKGNHKVGGEELFRAVLERVAATRETVKDACVHISRHNRRWQSHNPRALETAYYRHFKEELQAQGSLHDDPVFGPLLKCLGYERLLTLMAKISD